MFQTVPEGHTKKMFQTAPEGDSKKFEKISKKNCAKFFYWKNFRFHFSEFSRKCLENSSKGTQNNQEKISSSFRDFSKKHAFLDLNDPSPTIHHHHPFVNTRWRGTPGTPEAEAVRAAYWEGCYGRRVFFFICQY